jgi:hypothetical protein
MCMKFVMNMRGKVKCMYNIYFRLIILAMCSDTLFTSCTAISRRAALAEELAMLRQVDEFASKGLSPPRGKNGFAR